MTTMKLREITPEEAESRDYGRASGLADCQKCGQMLYKHETVRVVPSWQDSLTLSEDCLGRLWKT